MEKSKENLIEETTDSSEGEHKFGFEMESTQAGRIATELSTFADLITHDKTITTEDLLEMDIAVRGVMVNIGGEHMSIEDIPDLKLNVEIWKEMKEGNFENTRKLTRITPEVSKYLENNKGNIVLDGLTSAKGLILPQSIGGSLFLNGLTSIEHLVLPQSIALNIWVDSLPSTEKRKLHQSYPQYTQQIQY